MSEQQKFVKDIVTLIIDLQNFRAEEICYHKCCNWKWMPCQARRLDMHKT